MKSATIQSWTDETVPGVVDISNWTKLSYLDIYKSRFMSMPVFPSTLTHLKARAVRIGGDEFDAYQKAVFPFEKLEYLSVEDSDLFTLINDMANPALTSGSLKTLKVGSDIGAIETTSRNDWTQTLPAPSTALETLSLDQRNELPEQTIMAVLRQYPNLKEVDLAFTLVTGSTLRELFERENKPEYINVKHCPDCYHDAVEVARQAGIEVDYELAPKNKNRADRAWRDQYYN